MIFFELFYTFFFIGMFTNISILSTAVDIIQWPFEKIIGLIMVPFEILYSMIGL